MTVAETTHRARISGRYGRTLPLRTMRDSIRIGRVGTALILMALPLAGCTTQGGPSFVMFGAFFPSWLLCGIIGIVAAILARALFLMTGLSNIIPLQFLVCCSIGVIVSMLIWIFILAPGA